jgi:hypothetical protein
MVGVIAEALRTGIEAKYQIGRIPIVEIVISDVLLQLAMKVDEVNQSGAGVLASAEKERHDLAPW